MCIVTFTPTSKGFIFTSNRDENKYRKTIHPKLYTHQQHKLLYPKDLEKGGTWFAINNDQKEVACLLNATGKIPQSNPRISRGQVVLSYLTDDKNFMLENQLLKTAPFILIIISFSINTQIVEYHWNGKQLFKDKRDENKPQLWCSNTLYSREKKLSLTAKFEQQVLQSDRWKSIIHFHEKIALPLNSSYYKIKDKNIQTVSITSLNSWDKSKKTYYVSLI